MPSLSIELSMKITTDEVMNCLSFHKAPYGWIMCAVTAQRSPWRTANTTVGVWTTVNTLKTWGWCAPLSAGWIRPPAEATPLPPPGPMAILHLSGRASWPPAGTQDTATMGTDIRRSRCSKDTDRYSSLLLIRDVLIPIFPSWYKCLNLCIGR